MSRMFTCLAAATLAAGSAMLAGPLPTAQAAIIVTGRYSEVSYHTVNLTDGVPPPTAISSTSSLTVTFFQSFFEVFDHFTVVGAHNTGTIHVFQNSSVSSTSLFADTSQSGFVTTDFNGPAVFTNSFFSVDFQVDAPIEMTLTGEVVGSSVVGAGNFARVLLTENFGPIFNTAFGHSFPFVYTFQPGYTYNLQVQSQGQAFAAPPFTPTFVETSSSAKAELTGHVTGQPAVIPEPGALWLVGAGAGLIGYGHVRCKRRPRSLAGVPTP